MEYDDPGAIDPHYANLCLRLSELADTAVKLLNDDECLTLNALLKRLDEKIIISGSHAHIDNFLRLTKSYMSDINEAVKEVNQIYIDVKERNNIIKGLELLNKKIKNYADTKMARVGIELLRRSCPE